VFFTRAWPALLSFSPSDQSIPPLALFQALALLYWFFFKVNPPPLSGATGFEPMKWRSVIRTLFILHHNHINAYPPSRLSQPAIDLNTYFFR
jgi:hypothetical protein